MADPAAYLRLLKENRDFRRLLSAHLISLGGDWFNSVALLGLTLELTDSGFLASLVLVANILPHFLVSPISGVVVDAVDRKKLMVTSDLLRAVLALGMLAVRTPATVWIGIAALSGITALSAFFTPASHAALPNLVTGSQLGRANVLMGSAWGTMLAVGAAIGGVVATLMGRDTAFVINAASFLVSALLILGIRGRFSEEADGHREIHPVRDIVEGIDYARSHPKVLALLATKGGFGLGAGVIALLPIFATDVFRAGDVGIGLLFAARGLGALIGPIGARALVGDDQRKLFLALGGAMALYGVSYAAFAGMPLLALAALMDGIAHLGGGAQWMLSTFGLQALTPDRIRGRIFAFDFAIVTFTLSGSLMLAGWASEIFGPRTVMLALGAVEVLYGAVFLLLTRRLRKDEAPPLVSEERPVTETLPETLSPQATDRRA
jgi:MFS family permease